MHVVGLTKETIRFSEKAEKPFSNSHGDVFIRKFDDSVIFWILGTDEEIGKKQCKKRLK